HTVAHRSLHPFPTRRSSDLVSVPACGVPLAAGTVPKAPDVVVTEPLGAALEQAARPAAAATAHATSAVARRDLLTVRDRAALRPDRKSTRLNSSHVAISYAV